MEVSSADYKKYITKNYDLRLTVSVSLVELKDRWNLYKKLLEI